MGQHLSLAPEKKSQANRPTSDLSPASNASRVVARSSQVDSRLHLLECDGMSVALIGALGSQPVEGDCTANRPNSGVANGVQVEGNSRENFSRGAVKGGSSAVLNMACEL